MPLQYVGMLRDALKPSLPVYAELQVNELSVVSCNVALTHAEPVYIIPDDAHVALDDNVVETAAALASSDVI